MATHRGLDGFLALGGYVVGVATPRTAAGYAQGITTINIDAATSLHGVVGPGDQFTIAGETGAPVHTVQNVVKAAANALTGVQISPAIATGGVASQAAITFVSNAIVNARVWGVQVDQELIDTSKFQSGWKEYVGGQGSWRGNGEAWLDYDDPRQKALLDRLIGTTPSAETPMFTFGAGATGPKQFYGAAFLSGVAIAAQVNNVITLTFTITGAGSLLPDWT